jgi:hypothetical protein
MRVLTDAASLVLTASKPELLMFIGMASHI